MGEVIKVMLYGIGGFILILFLWGKLWDKLWDWIFDAHHERRYKKQQKKYEKEMQQIKEKRFKEFGVKRTLVDADNITAQELLDQLLELTKNNKIVALSKETLYEFEPDKILKISEKVPKEKVIQEWIWDAQPVNSSSYKLYILTTDEEKAYYRASSFLKDK